MVRSLIVAAALAGMSSATHASTLVLDRGLPNTNLNNISGANRSNVAWGYLQSSSPLSTSGDDYMLGATGSASNPLWRIDTLRIWIVAGPAGDPTFTLSDRYINAQLYLKNGSGPMGLVQAGTFTAGNVTDNPNIIISAVQYPTVPGQDYETTTSTFAQIWQVDFTNLGIEVAPGDQVQFFPFGATIDPSRAWFNHASNAALSGTAQQGADNLFRFLDLSDFTNTGTVDSFGNGWDKSSDINVQVFATAVPTPGTAAVLALGGLLAARRRRA
ncbi:hypothetical protein J4558_17730 [Leptolyngbya sp. 15MV]|nr:hypothetical protein J4558_17730 [Leptolyngbya sp. 15MV]